MVHRNWIVTNLINLYNNEKIALPKFSNDINNCSRCKMTTICESIHTVVK